MIGLALLALLLEALLGYSQRLVDRIGHPVIWIGRLIGAMDRAWNDAVRGFAARRLAGVVALLVLLGVAGGTGLALQSLLLALPFGIIPAALLASSLLAQRSLHEHVARVATALEQGGLDAGREAVSHIVGRDPLSLDEAGVARAAIESLAENFSDGVVAPAFWLALGGLPGAAIYKAVNTADSMIGHRTPRHEAFGWAAARLDDVLNWVPARLTAVLIAVTHGHFDRAPILRDGPLHRSPNAGWPEAAMAVVLDVSLSGPRSYHGQRQDFPWVWPEGRRDPGPADIDAACAALWRTWAGLLALIAIVALI
jgi:adenosylcobinamide-phosphate synthase